jgi:DNA mismatch repair protein MutS
MSTGAFTVSAVDRPGLAAELARIAPREVLVPDRLLADPELAAVLTALGPALSPLPQVKFDSGSGERALKAFYRVAALDGFGAFDRAELSAAGAVVGYLELTQKGRLPALGPPARISGCATMAIDQATRRNLELTETLAGGRAGSLLAAIDRTVTAGGARALAARLASPLTDPGAIALRLDAIGRFAGESDLRDNLRDALRRAPDLARALARLSVGRGGPRDLASIRDGLAAAAAVVAMLASFDDALKPSPGEAGTARDDLRSGVGATHRLAGRLAGHLVPEPPFWTRDGGFIAGGAHQGLDEARTLRDESRKFVAALETRYRGESGVTALKIRHNGVLGYFIEVTPVHAEKLLASPVRALFRHRQTIGSAVRFSTDELATLAGRIAEAADTALAIEKELFESLGAEAVAAASSLSSVADALARLDVSAALAELAVERRYVRPQIDASFAFDIARGRHPVVEALLGGAFVANDCRLAREERLWLVTGPNMAGKSTFLRQNALIAILAQAGSFVPAESAHIGIVDRLFSRVGASDDLARGRSTFMVEMVETAAILNQATERSLVILDEIGRGTATFDGLAIAWATLEHLHGKNRARALFATHYHELTALASRLDALVCVTMRVREWNDEIVFLHEVAKGAADRSYGIHVAKLAGLPASVIARAEDVLRALEDGREGHRPLARIDDLPLFSAAMPAKVEAKANAVDDALREVFPDTLTPKAALDLVYALKAMLAEKT